MKQRQYLLIAFAAIIVFAAGCSSDSVIDNDEPCEGDSCTTTPHTDGDLCKDNSSTCRDNQTLQKCVKDQKPTYEICAKGCDQNACRTDGDDIICEKDSSNCVDTQYLTVCVTGSKPEIVDCSTKKSHGVCKISECVEDTPPVGLGQPCDEKTVWVDNAYCDFGVSNTCIAYRQQGETCTNALCNTGLLCHDGTCHKILNIGDKCEEYTVCNSGRCDSQGICRSITNVYESCETSLCPENTVCIDKVCVPTKGECESNANCKGDSYCCTDVSCGDNRNVCIPYSDNSNNEACLFSTVPGMFEASIQCIWRPTQAPDSNLVANTISVGKIHNTQNIDKPLIAFNTSNTDPDHSPHFWPTSSWLRIIHPDTCEDIESIQLNSPYTGVGNSVSLADFDGDGYMELVVLNGSDIAIYSWNGTNHVPTFVSNINIGGSDRTFSIHDLDNDGTPEIITSNGTVVHSDGTVLSSPALSTCNHTAPALGDLNGDGNVEFMAANIIYRWQNASNGWTPIATLTNTQQSQFAYADFGTPGSDSSSFDFEHFDGIAEIVVTDGSDLKLWAIFASDGSLLPSPQNIMQHSTSTSAWGYPPAIGDFNGDGKPEIGVASKSTFGVYDPKCETAVDGQCTAKNIVWEQPTHDQSGIAGASAFDFDGDGKIEIVYGDECFTRVYDGATGEVLFSSYRNSGTQIEYPVIADVDNDGSTEIVISSDYQGCGIPQDDSHRGVKCEKDTDCYSNSCIGGLCRCSNDNQCNWQTIDGEIFKQYSCLAPLDGDTVGGNVCRAVQGDVIAGITILRDRLDRWVSSRTIWNQHAYNITNVNDDGTIPKTSEWTQNFTDRSLNNYRQQKQGKTGAGVAPDITGRFTSLADICKTSGEEVLLNAQVCNRGTKDVGSKMPAVFYKNEIKPENILCVSYTDEKVPLKSCRDVSCAITKEQAQTLQSQKIILLVNDDGKGGKTTVECDEGNNTDEIMMTSSCVDN